MAMNKTFRTKKPRLEVDVRFQCYADPVLFLPWEEMNPQAQKEITNNGSIPCEGGGMPGEWCANCRFGKTLAPVIV